MVSRRFWTKREADTLGGSQSYAVPREAPFSAQGVPAFPRLAGKDVAAVLLQALGGRCVPGGNHLSRPLEKDVSSENMSV